jgi:hypothetical protein
MSETLGWMGGRVLLQSETGQGPVPFKKKTGGDEESGGGEKEMKKIKSR